MAQSFVVRFSRLARGSLLVSLATLATLDLAVADPLGPTLVRRIQVSSQLDGPTLVEVVANRPFVPYSYRHYPVRDGQPRLVLILPGIVEAYSETVIPVADANLLQVRVGYHPEQDPPELHLVFDLAAPEVELLGLSQNGARLRVRLGRLAHSEALEAPEPVPTTTVGPPDPSATPTPVQPAPVPTLRATTTPSPPPLPSPPTETVTLYRSPNGSSGASVTRGLTASRLTEVVVTRRADGAVLVRATADLPYLRHSVIDYREAREPNRHVLLLLGVVTEGAPLRPEVGDPCLTRVEFASSGQETVPETRITLVLGSSEVRVAKVATSGPNLAVLLLPP